MPGSASPWAHLACPPNATRQAPPMAAATQERRLLAVACTRLFGAAQHARQFRQGFAVIGCLGMPATDQDGAQTHCLSPPIQICVTPPVLSAHCATPGDG